MGAKAASRRRLYQGGHPNRLANALNRLTLHLADAGLAGGRVMNLEVRGRRSGKPMATPIVVARVDGERYLVSMLGQDSAWVLNARAAGGDAVLRHRGREPVRLDEVPVADRAPIIRAYLEVAPGARAHIPVERGAPVEEFEAIAADFPVFRIVARH